MDYRRYVFRAAVLVCALAVPGGCRKADSGASGNREADRKSTSVRVQDLDFPAAVGNSDLQWLATNYKQLSVLMQQNPLPYASVESLGWTISRKAQALVERYNHDTKERADADLGTLIDREAPEYNWMKAGQGIRDLDLVAINARRMALAAGSLDIDGVREKFANLQKAAGRCLPGATATQ
jgi:hypothetical protein